MTCITFRVLYIYIYIYMFIYNFFCKFFPRRIWGSIFCTFTFQFSVIWEHPWLILSQKARLESFSLPAPSLTMFSVQQCQRRSLGILGIHFSNTYFCLLRIFQLVLQSLCTSRCGRPRSRHEHAPRVTCCGCWRLTTRSILASSSASRMTFEHQGKASYDGS